MIFSIRISNVKGFRINLDFNQSAGDSHPAQVYINTSVLQPIQHGPISGGEKMSVSPFTCSSCSPSRRVGRVHARTPSRSVGQVNLELLERWPG